MVKRIGDPWPTSDFFKKNLGLFVERALQPMQWNTLRPSRLPVQPGPGQGKAAIVPGQGKAAIKTGTCASYGFALGKEAVYNIAGLQQCPRPPFSAPALRSVPPPSVQTTVREARDMITIFFVRL